MSSVDDAIALAKEYGFYVFPVHGAVNGKCTCGKDNCSRIGKHPAIRKNWIAAASNQEGEIRKLWSEPKIKGELNIGVRTGTKLPDGGFLFVMDVDCGEGKKGEDSFRALGGTKDIFPLTFHVHTGSGGHHYYFSTPFELLSNASGKLGKDIDTRGEGGYVIAPPSKHKSGGEYKFEDPLFDIFKFEDGKREAGWLWKLLVEKCGKKIEKKTDVEHPSSSQSPEISHEDFQSDLLADVQSSIDLRKSQLESIDVTQLDYDQWWKIGASLKHDLGEHGFALWDEWSKQDSQRYNGHEMRKKWESFDTERGITGATIGGMAKESGWKPTPEQKEVQRRKQVVIIPNDLFSRWVYHEYTGKFIDLLFDSEKSRDDFNAEFFGKHPEIVTKNPAQLLLDNPKFNTERKVYGYTFMPEEDKVFIDPLVGKRCINLWRDPGLVPEPGDVSIFLQHLDYLIPDDRQRITFLRWLAYIVQKPGSKVSWAIMLIGGSGVGKSWLKVVFEGLFGVNNVHTVTNEIFKSDFNAVWSKESRICVFEEVLQPSDRVEISNKLKSLITDDWITVNEKNVKPFRMPNRMNFFLISNYINAVTVEDDERRYYVIRSVDVKREDGYYDKIWNWVRDKRNFPYLLDYLMNMDLSAFNPGIAERTEGFMEMARQSKRDWEVDIIERVSDSLEPFDTDIVSTEDCLEVLRKVYPHLNGVALGRFFRKMRFVELGPQRVFGKLKKWYSVRNHSLWTGKKGKDIELLLQGNKTIPKPM